VRKLSSCQRVSRHSTVTATARRTAGTRWESRNGTRALRAGSAATDMPQAFKTFKHDTNPVKNVNNATSS
jgi:hypothetical protein